MRTDRLNNETIRHYIPNTFAEAEGETPLYDKLSPFLSSARLWLESEYLGADDFLSEAHNELALKVLVAKAFADAVPSLDLLLTPSGFGVISTENMAPASKDRVERLISSLRNYVRANLVLLVDFCRTYEAWRSSERGRYFCSTFFPSIRDYYRHGYEDDGKKSFAEMHDGFTLAESLLAERYLGSDFMDALRSDFVSGTVSEYHPLVVAVRRAVSGAIPAGDVPVDQNRLWHCAAPVIRLLESHPDYRSIWERQMGGLFSSPAFVNNIQGGYFF